MSVYEKTQKLSALIIEVMTLAEKIYGSPLKREKTSLAFILFPGESATLRDESEESRCFYADLKSDYPSFFRVGKPERISLVDLERFARELEEAVFLAAYEKLIEGGRGSWGIKIFRFLVLGSEKDISRRLEHLVKVLAVIEFTN